MSQEYDQAARRLASDLVDNQGLSKFVGTMVPQYNENCKLEEDTAYWEQYSKVSRLTILKAVDSMKAGGALKSLMSEYLKECQELEDSPMTDEEVEKYLERFNDFVEYINHVY